MDGCTAISSSLCNVKHPIDIDQHSPYSLIFSTMTTTAPAQAPNAAPTSTELAEDYNERAAQVAALVAARKAKLALEKKKAEEKAEKSKLYELMFGDKEEEVSCHEETKQKKEFKQFRVGGAKGKEGRADHTRGKSAFKRPCTVGWKSQNQPLMKGGGNRTPL